VLIFKRKVAHIVGVAEWSSFNLHVDESSVLLGFADHPFPFLSWKSDTSGFPLFSPVYLSAGSEDDNLLGLNFPLEGTAKFANFINSSMKSLNLDCMTFQEDVKEAKFFELAGQTHLFFRVNQWQKSSQLIQNNGRLDLYIRGTENGKFGLAFSTLGDFKNGYDLIRFSETSVIYLRMQG
jgi:hypothetical protein